MDSSKQGRERRLCPECDGTGNFYRNDEDGDFLPCDDCDGTGYMKVKALFVLKYRDTFDAWNDEETKRDIVEKNKLSSGLIQSATFVSNALAPEVESKVVQVVDNNDIDREVHHFHPTHVFVEALWVVPEKFLVLARLHPKVKWLIRVHSEVPFLASEGVAMSWIPKYVAYPNVYLAPNAPGATEDCKTVVGACHPSWTEKQIEQSVVYLPNNYPLTYVDAKNFPPGKPPDEFYDVACFGAIRPMKNHLMQAVASLKVAKQLGKRLRFHINGRRTEQGGDMVLNNLQRLFGQTPEHQLIEHGWLGHGEFKALLTKMDVGLQVSFSETFNIVAADMVVGGLPIVTSPEIVWTSPQCQAEPTSSDDIATKMLRAEAVKHLNLRGLKKYCEVSRKIWLKYLGV